MAIVKFGSIITDARGGLAGHQLKGNVSGIVLMTRQLPVNRKTAEQLFNRALTANLTERWGVALSDADRQDWSDLAAANLALNRWGATYSITGLGMFQRVNKKRQQAALAIFTTAPTDQVVTAPLTATLTASAGPTLSLAFTTAPAPANHRVRVYAAPPQGPGTSVATKRYRRILITGTTPTSPIDITANYETKYGPLQTNKKIFVRLTYWNQSNGAESAAQDTYATT